MPILLSLDGPNAGKKYLLTRDSVIGRSYESDIYLSDLNVSRSHARILVKDSTYILEDMGSGNGTYVNDTLVKRQHTLEDQDVVRVGGSSFRFQEAAKKKAWFPEVLTVVADSSEAQAIVEEKLKPGRKQDRSPDEERDAAVLCTAEIDGDVIRSALASLGEDDAEEDLEKTEPRTREETKSNAGAERMLEAMYAVADAIAQEVEQDKLLVKILDHLFDVFPQAERGFVLLVNEKTGQLVPEAVKQLQGSSGGLQFSQTIVRDVMDGGEGIIRGATIPPISREASREILTELPTGLPERKPVASSREPKIGTPLTCRGESLGTITLEGAEGSKAFSKEDLDLLSAIGRQAAMAIANSRAGQALIVQNRLESDLTLAREIQKSFLPRKLPRFPDLKVGAHYEAAFQVGGDFYDIIKLGPTRLGIVVGDISGKGVSAALMMAKMITDIRLLSHYHQSPGKVLTLANDSLQETGQPGMFCTVLYILLDLGQCSYTMANAGHQPPLIASRRFEGICELDDATAVALGIIDDVEYPEKTYKLIPGDSVLLYTDGINEAMSPRKEEYGMDRLRKVLANGPTDPEHTVARVVADVHRFVRGAPQSDDQTVVAFGLTSDPAARPMDVTLKT